MSNELCVRDFSAEQLDAVTGGNDRLGNFEIQNLMSTYNQAETLYSNVMRRMQQSSSSVIQKIG